MWRSDEVAPKKRLSYASLGGSVRRSRSTVFMMKTTRPFITSPPDFWAGGNAPQRWRPTGLPSVATPWGAVSSRKRQRQVSGGVRCSLAGFFVGIAAQPPLTQDDAVPKPLGHPSPTVVPWGGVGGKRSSAGRIATVSPPQHALALNLVSARRRRGCLCRIAVSTTAPCAGAAGNAPLWQGWLLQVGGCGQVSSADM